MAANQWQINVENRLKKLEKKVGVRPTEPKSKPGPAPMSQAEAEASAKAQTERKADKKAPANKKAKK